MAKITTSRIFFGVSVFFFFLGFVVFEGLKIEFFNSQINPFVVTGFGFAFLGLLAEFNGSVAKFINKITNS
ncbi:MAG: hypothetical protein KJI69_04110 [Patescibacteria group bacterium]|nr:hypothetical protein [Patescibacteria group bacterium]